MDDKEKSGREAKKKVCLWLVMEIYMNAVSSILPSLVLQHLAYLGFIDIVDHLQKKALVYFYL